MTGINLQLALVLAGASLTVLATIPKDKSDQRLPAVIENQFERSAGAQPPVSIAPNIKKSNWPLDSANKRITKKPFGIFVAPQNSPIRPERFSGFHTGTDFEVFPEEVETDVAIYAICSGKIIFKKIANGYGGVIVQACGLDNQPITVVYGHLKLASITENQSLKINDKIGILGKQYSQETDGERKHLHLGIHKGANINLRGYVANQTELKNWLDPKEVLGLKL